MEKEKKENLIDVLKVSLSLIIGGVTTYYLLETQSPNSIFGVINILFLMIIGFYTTILLHEIGHIIGFKLYGYEILFIAVGPIIYINNLNKTIKLKYNNFILGGCVIPNIGEINSCDKREQFTKAFQLSLVLGPIINVITAFICMTYMIAMKNVSVYVYFVMITSITTFAYSFIKALEVKGDLYIFFESRNNSNFIIPYIYKYSILNDCCTEYVDNLMKDVLKCVLEKKRLETDDVNTLGEFIDYYSVNLNILPEFINQFIDYWMENYNLFEYKSSFHQQTMCIVFHKYIYNKICVNDQVEQYKKFYKSYIYENDVVNISQLQFYKERSEFILKINKNENYSNKIKNLYKAMILEYLLEKYDYINKLVKTDF